MPASATTPSEPILDLAKPMAERQLALLGRLAEIGLQIAEQVGVRAEAAPADDDLTGVAMAYSRVSRAVRLSLMLQSKLLKDLEDRLSQASHTVAEAQSNDEAWRKAHIERAVERAAKARHGDDEDGIDRLMAECGERLDYEDYGWLLARPIGEIVANICRDLGLDADGAAAGGVEDCPSSAVPGEVDVAGVDLEPPRTPSSPREGQSFLGELGVLGGSIKAASRTRSASG